MQLVLLEEQFCADKSSTGGTSKFVPAVLASYDDFPPMTPGE
jgi:hypothetical protein